MGSHITSRHDCIILDACCVMNLYASRRMAGIVSSIRETVAVAVYVMDFEALSVYSSSKSASPQEREPIDLQPLIDDGLLIPADLETEAEDVAFIDFTSQRLDDSEAATMAIAVNRNWAVATDDRVARRICGQQHQNIQLISTPELVRHWVETKEPDERVVGRAILDIESRANYLVG